MENSDEFTPKDGCCRRAQLSRSDGAILLLASKRHGHGHLCHSGLTVDPVRVKIIHEVVHWGISARLIPGFPPFQKRKSEALSPVMIFQDCVMATPAGQRRLDIEEVGDVTVARFVDKKILDENNIQVIGNQMFGLVDQDKRKKIVLDFSNVEYLSSAALGKLITMNNKVKTAGGKLRLCSIRPDIYDVFTITKLNKLFDIKDDQAAALAGM